MKFMTSQKSEEVKSDDTVDLNRSDQVIEEGEAYTLIKNETQDSLLAFSIDNLYTNDKEDTFRKPLSMRKTPPTLEISSSDGSQVNIPLTRNFVKSLLRVLNDVNFAYLGLKKTKQRFNFGKKDEKPLSKISSIIAANKLSLIQLFIGMFIGIFISRGFTLGVVGLIGLSLLALVIAYSEKNKEDEVQEERGAEDVEE